MIKTIQEQKALEQVVQNLKNAVETQFKIVGYYFTPHYEVKKEQQPK